MWQKQAALLNIVLLKNNVESMKNTTVVCWQMLMGADDGCTWPTLTTGRRVCGAGSTCGAPQCRDIILQQTGSDVR